MLRRRELKSGDAVACATGSTAVPIRVAIAKATSRSDLRSAEASIGFNPLVPPCGGVDVGRERDRAYVRAAVLFPTVNVRQAGEPSMLPAASRATALIPKFPVVGGTHENVHDVERAPGLPRVAG